MERWEFDANNIVPYNFEPRYSDSRGESGEGGSGGNTAGAAASLSPPAEPEAIAAVTIREWDQADEDAAKWRLKHFVWCRCGGKCRQMKTVHESVCCHDLVEAEQRREGQGILCLTEHAGFKVVVLNKDVLECAMVAKLEGAEHQREDDDGYDDDDDYDDVGNNDDDDDDEALGAEAPEINNRAYRLQAYSQCCIFLQLDSDPEECVRRVIPSCVVQAINKMYPDPSGDFKSPFEDEGCL
ncbi:hypothetical protein Bbelb_086780 [Branchiostoma belcheri]|nr:hypothetical protein Bbelb_086780 [Branchiostoma belcheri]